MKKLKSLYDTYKSISNKDLSFRSWLIMRFGSLYAVSDYCRFLTYDEAVKAVSELSNQKQSASN